MKKKAKVIIIILIVLVALAIIIGGIWFWQKSVQEENKNNENVVQNEENVVEEYVQKLEDGSRLNISEELNKNKQLDELEISNIQLRETGGITTLLADVKNTGDITSSERRVNVDILDKQGNVITSLKGVIDEIPAGGSVQLNMAVTADVANAYDFRISNI